MQTIMKIIMISFIVYWSKFYVHRVKNKRLFYLKYEHITFVV